MSATIELRTVLAPEIDIDEATIRNSNLFPVNANGEVRLRSVASFLKFGRVETPVSIFPPLILAVASPLLIICSTISSSCSPRNIEIIAGGASLAPSLWSFPAHAADSLKRGAYLLTALITALSM